MNRKILPKLTAVILTLCLLCVSAIVSVTAVDETDETGTLTITFASFLEGNQIALYEVADVDQSGRFTLNQDFAGLQELLDENEVDINNLQNAEETESAALLAKVYAEEQPFLDEYAVRIDSEGRARFRNLSANKLYLAMQLTDVESNIFLQPILITIPYITDGETKYDVSIDASSKYVRGAPGSVLGAVILHKTDDENTPLEGAEFQFFQKIYYSEDIQIPVNAETGSDEEGNFYWKPFSSTLTTDSKGLIVVNDLPFGTYRFIEKKAPEGYVLDETVHQFKVTDYAHITAENNVLGSEGKPVDVSVKNVKQSGDEPNPEPSPDDSVPDSTTSFSTSIGTESEPSPVSPSTPSVTSTPNTSKPSVITSVPESITINPASQPDAHFEITGDDVIKYVVIGAIVLVSLTLIILLFVSGGKKENEKEKKKK